MWQAPHDTDESTRDTDSGSVSDAMVDLSELVRPRMTPRKRAFQVGSVVVLVAVVTGLILHSLSGLGKLSAALQPTPTAIPVFVALDSNVTFGTMTFNGKTLTDPLPHLVSPRDGTNTMTLNAPPFLPVTCQFTWSGQQIASHAWTTSVSTSNSNTCSYSTGSAISIVAKGQTVSVTTVIALALNSDNLPPDLQESAFEAVKSAISSAQLHTTVPVGQHYATGLDSKGNILSRQATTPLRADLVFPSPASLGGCGNTPLCATQLDPQRDRGSASAVWAVSYVPNLQWQFTLPSGAHVVSPLVQSPQTAIEMALAYDPVAGWRVTWDDPALSGNSALYAQLQGTVCNSGTNVLLNLLPQHGQNNGVGYQGGNSIEGCALQVTTSTGATLATFTWRFGVLLATDKKAHALLPSLPVASAAEIAAVNG